MWDFVWRNGKDLSLQALKILYCSLVRSQFDYFSSVSSPIYSTDCQLLENVQKKFLRTLEFKLGRSHVRGNYSWIMNAFNIQTLNIRRCISDACVLHSIINNSIDNSFLLARLSFLVPTIDSCSTLVKTFSEFLL